MTSRTPNTAIEAPALGIGFYTAPEAARLLRMPARTINRWLGGYAFTADGHQRRMPPLWTPELPANNQHLELGFRDLIELRFVQAFVREQVDLRVIRRCLETAREAVQDPRPFSTRRFKTDGRTIFLESLKADGESEVIDLTRGQYVIRAVIEQTFRDLDIEGDVVTRWRPFQGRDTIVIDPRRAFGQPIAAGTGVPTVALADAVRAEGTVERVARLYEIPVAVVRDAMRFEASLQAA
ncbi:DUF433 domain-containing protein [Methylobacterium sp. DCY52]|uniref:DUF433 domain-containing protein n=1 Tax=Methylobacterium sp. DCY52 TaxID=739139 RepID=UPI0031452891